MTDSHIILDVRGLIIRAASSADKTIQDGEKQIPSWQDGLAKFIDREIIPLVTAGVAPRQILAVWDAGNTYRQGLYSQYKAKRLARETSEVSKKENQKLFSKAKELLAALGVRQVSVPGEEADDVIALLTQKIEGNHHIITVDEDLLQLLSNRVSLKVGHDHFTWEMDADRTTSKGTSIRHLVLYKAIVGDSSDEYGGVKGLGPKAWESLAIAVGREGLDWMLQAVENNWADAFMQWAAASGHKVLNTLAANWVELRKGWQLAKLNPEICFGAIDGKPKRPQWHVRVPDLDKLTSLLVEVNSDFLLDTFKPLMPREVLMDTSMADRLQELSTEILASPIVSWDYESSDKKQYPNYRRAGTKDYVDVLSQEIAGISINFGKNLEKTIYVPFDHADTANFNLDWLKWLISVLNARQTVVQNAAFEVTLTLTNLGVWATPPFDTAIMAMYVDENEENHLKAMSRRVLDYRQLSYQETTQGRRMDQLTGREVLKYGCDDSLVTSHLFDVYRLILQTEGTWDFYKTYEVEPIVEDVYSFVTGTDLDLKLLEEQRQQQEKVIAEQRAALHKALDENVNKDHHAEPYHRVLFDEWFALAHLKALGKANEEQRLQDLTKELWDKAWNACWYHPYSETVEEVTWKPTAAAITGVARSIVPGAPKMSSLSVPKAKEYVEELRKFLDQNPSADLDRFADLLEMAADDLPASKRNSYPYLQFKEFCEEQANLKPKVTSEGDELNTGSSVQMQELLYGKLRLPIRYRSKVQKGSTRDAHGLQGAPGTGLKAIAAALVYDVPEGSWKADALHAYRTIALAQQAGSLYYSKYPDWVSPEDGKLHPQIKNCGTVTRRPSGSSPNILQVSSKEGGAIRKLFPAGDYGDGERVYVSIDWKGQELLILACESKDPVLLDAFTSNPRKDIHSTTGSGISSILMPRHGGPAGRLSYDDFQSILHDKDHELNSIVKLIRGKYSKGINFLLAYGGGFRTLAENLLIQENLAKDIYYSTLDLYAGLKPWQQQVSDFARRTGYSMTAYGNRRHMTKDLWSSDDGLVKRMERQAFNSVIQSTAADILKVTKQAIHDRDMVNRYSLRAIKPIYDEITASVPIDLATAYALEMKEVMSITPPGYPVALEVDIEIGRTWGDQIEVLEQTQDGIDAVINQIRNQS